MVNDLHQLLAEGVVVVDGAMGTLLQQRGIPHGHPYDFANLTHPSIVQAIHDEYVAAGAHVIETNTYGANHFKLSAHGLEERVGEINRVGAEIARRAVDGRALVAGSIGPIGRHLAPIGKVAPEEAAHAFREQVQGLLEGGVDFFLLETFATLEELRLAVDAVRASCDLPIIAHKTFIEDGETIAAGLPRRVVAQIADWGLAAFGANCTAGPQRMLTIVQGMAESAPLPLSAMPTAGLPQIVDGHVTYDATPEYFARYGRQMVEAGLRIVGGCCGTTPAHIRALAQAVRGAVPGPRLGATTGEWANGGVGEWESGRVGDAATDGSAVAPSPLHPFTPSLPHPHSPTLPLSHTAQATPVSRPPSPVFTPTPPHYRSRLAEKLGRKYVVVVELDVPRGLDLAPVLRSAEALRDQGCDCIDISDGARARLRMNPMVVARQVQELVGIEVVQHFACRDRNLLAIQADLLGAHALGLRNILAVTGDPTQIGDYPTATSVFDVDSIGLVRILRCFNEGVDLAGTPIGEKTAFLIAVAFNPLAPDLAHETDRLRRKAAEGAHVVYTQPIYEQGVLECAVREAERVGLPLLVGVLPLRSSRHAEFFHNEVPGITIPDEIRRRLASLEGDDARRFGVEEAQAFLREARPMTAGVYIMPPALSPQVAGQVMEALEGSHLVRS